MFAQNLLFRLRHMLFDARDAMVAGVGLFACCLAFLQLTPTQAHVSYSGPADSRFGAMWPNSRANVQKQATLPKELFSKRMRRKMFGLNYATPSEDSLSTRRQKQAALAVSVPVPKKKYEIAPAGKPQNCTGLVTFDDDGKTKLISPCVKSLLTGNFENLPERATNFFIDAMNDPKKADKVPEVAINSFLAMMEAMAKQADKK